MAARRMGSRGLGTAFVELVADLRCSVLARTTPNSHLAQTDNWRAALRPAYAGKRTMGKAHVAGGLAASVGIGASFVDDVARLGVRGMSSTVDDVARIGVLSSTADDAARLAGRGLGSTADDAARLAGRGLGSTADDAARLSGRRLVSSTVDDAAHLGARRAVWGPRVGTPMEETAASALPNRGPVSGRWVQEAIEQGAELVVDSASFDSDGIELDAFLGEAAPLTSPPPFLVAVATPEMLTEDAWRSPDVRLTIVHVDDPVIDALAIQGTCIAEHLRCLVVRCPPGSLVCREAAQFAWADVTKKAEERPGPEPEDWYLTQLAHEVSFSADVGIQLEAVVADGQVAWVVRTRPGG
jgi:hypothetical protein